MGPTLAREGYNNNNTHTHNMGRHPFRADVNSAARLRLVDFHFYWPPRTLHSLDDPHLSRVLYYSLYDYPSKGLLKKTLRTCVNVSFSRFFSVFFLSLFLALPGKICVGTATCAGMMYDLWSSAVIVVRGFLGALCQYGWCTIR